MKYLKLFAGSDAWKEITYDEALDTVLGSYQDNDEVRDMLGTPNRIRCQYSEIAVVPDGNHVVEAGCLL